MHALVHLKLKELHFCLFESFQTKNVNVFMKIDRFRSIFIRILKIKKQIKKPHTLKLIYLYYTPAACESTAAGEKKVEKGRVVLSPKLMVKLTLKQIKSDR